MIATLRVSIERERNAGGWHVTHGLISSRGMLTMVEAVPQQSCGTEEGRRLTDLHGDHARRAGCSGPACMASHDEHVRACGAWTGMPTTQPPAGAAGGG